MRSQRSARSQSRRASLFSSFSLPFPTGSRRGKALMALSGAAALASSSLLASAANFTWNGGGAADNSWTTALNWIGGVAPVANDALVFDGAISPTNINTFTADTQFNGITFNT